MTGTHGSNGGAPSRAALARRLSPLRHAAAAVLVAALGGGLALVGGLGGGGVALAAAGAAALGMALSVSVATNRGPDGTADRLATSARSAVPDDAGQPVAADGMALQPGIGRALLDKLPSGLILIDGTEKVMYHNGAAEALFERRMTGMRYVTALRAPALTDAVVQALTAAAPTDVEFTLLRAKERRLHASVRPLTGATRLSDPHVMLTLDDRTRAAKAEELRRDFVANASHELKTPLASILGFIETLQGHARDDPEATQRFLGIMLRQAERMKQLVDDLLSLNRIEINEHVRPTEPVDLRELACELCAALTPIADAAGARIIAPPPGRPLMIRGSREELSQVFVNLIDNAIKYAGDDGPVTVDFVEDNPPRAAMIGVRVSDKGPGIAREHLPRLTERFYRIDVARSRERGGTGLGLAIAKHVLNRHRAELTIVSALGEGAQFTAWFPRQPAEAGATPQTFAKPTAAAGPRS